MNNNDEKKRIDGCTLGEYVKSIRKNRNFTIEKVAQLSGLSTGYISKIEKDKNKTYNINTLKELAHALKIDTNKILQYVGFEETSDQEVPEENTLIAYLRGQKLDDYDIKDILTYIEYIKNREIIREIIKNFDKYGITNNPKKEIIKKYTK